LRPACPRSAIEFKIDLTDQIKPVSRFPIWSPLNGLPARLASCLDIIRKTLGGRQIALHQHTRFSWHCSAAQPVRQYASQHRQRIFQTLPPADRQTCTSGWFVNGAPQTGTAERGLLYIDERAPAFKTSGLHSRRLRSKNDMTMWFGSPK
jgi:hypothetical protein